MPVNKTQLYRKKQFFCQIYKNVIFLYNAYKYSVWFEYERSIMQLLTVILKKEELLDDILKKLAEQGVKGGTILDGRGMGEELANMEDLPMFGMLRRVLKDEEKETCKVALFVVRDEQIVEARETVKSAVNLKEPNTGIMFVVPLTYVEGLGK